MHNFKMAERLDYYFKPNEESLYS